MKKSISIFLLFSLVTCFLISGCGNNKEVEKNKARACAATMRVMLGAVEMYNMDNKTMMRELNESNYNILVSKGYIKKDFKCTCPLTNKFQYSSTCDLVDSTSDILTSIKCENHGTIKDIDTFVKK